MMLSLTLATIMLALSSFTPAVASAAAFTATSPPFSLMSRSANLRSADTQVRLCAQASQPEHILQLCADIKEGGKTILLDVREPDEWTSGHLADACSAPLSLLSAGRWMDSKGKFLPGSFPIDPFTGVAIKKNAKIYIHCAAGMRAKKAAELFTLMGYSNVMPLAEGFQALATMEVSSVLTGGTNALID
jgi:rhodanese-related sulfurtransferase